MFEQRIQDGWQVEYPDFWLSYGNPWEIERVDVKYVISYGGNCEMHEENGIRKVRLRHPSNVVQGDQRREDCSHRLRYTDSRIQDAQLQCSATVESHSDGRDQPGYLQQGRLHDGP